MDAKVLGFAVDQNFLNFIGDNFSFEELSNKIIRTKIFDNKYVILKCECDEDALYILDELVVFLNFETKNQKVSVIDNEEYDCCRCDKYIKKEYFYNDYDERLCRKCFTHIKDNILIANKKNITFIYVPECPGFLRFYIIKDKIVKQINIQLIETKTFITGVKPIQLFSGICETCNEMREYSKQEKLFLCYNSVEKCNFIKCKKHLGECIYCSEKEKLYFCYDSQKKYDGVVCKKCLKFKRYASFMANENNFVYIKEIFEPLLPELKNIIVKYMLRLSPHITY
jgi:hypothetical protein